MVLLIYSLAVFGSLNKLLNAVGVVWPQTIAMAEFTSNEALHGISPLEIREQLARVLSSVHFVKAHRQSRFLRYLVEHSLEEQSDLREQTLGVEVFERGGSFAPAIDPIIRVAANRLRSRLRHYYRTEGKQYGGLRINQAKRRKDLERENSWLKRLVAELHLDKAILQEGLRGNF